MSSGPADFETAFPDLEPLVGVLLSPRGAFSFSDEAADVTLLAAAAAGGSRSHWICSRRYSAIK